MAQSAVTKYRALIVGGSAGSLEVILSLVEKFPVDAGMVYMIVLHRKNDAESVLSQLLATRTTMPVREAEDKDDIMPNMVYVAPPDYHLLLEDEQTFALDSSEKIHYSRPSIDVSFDSAAEIFGPSLIGILLSGANADGAAGLLKIFNAGGYSIVQDPKTADVDYMPRQAIELCKEHELVDGDMIAERVVQLISP